VVQSEHDGRTRAEKVAWTLLELLEAVLLGEKHNDNDCPRRNSRASTQCSSLGLELAGRKRTLEKANQEEIRSQAGTSHESESHSDHGRSHSAPGNHWKRYRAYYHLDGSSSTLRIPVLAPGRRWNCSTKAERRRKRCAGFNGRWGKSRQASIEPCSINCFCLHASNICPKNIVLLARQPMRPSAR